jgi:hypothetical protein
MVGQNNSLLGGLAAVTTLFVANFILINISMINIVVLEIDGSISILSKYLHKKSIRQRIIHETITKTYLVILSISVSTVLFLILLGSLAAFFGGAGILKGALRVTFWGVFAMGLTAGIGLLFGIK